MFSLDLLPDAKGKIPFVVHISLNGSFRKKKTNMFIKNNLLRIFHDDMQMTAARARQIFVLLPKNMKNVY